MVARRTRAQKDDIFFRVRDGDTGSVLRELKDGIEHSDGAEARYAPLDQSLMFFAAARKPELGGAEQIARRLHALGVPVDGVDTWWQTPLFYAAREGNLGCAAFLIKHGCSVDRLDMNRQSPVFYSVREGHFEMTELFLKSGASLEVRDSKGNTPLDYEPPNPCTPIKTKSSCSRERQKPHSVVESSRPVIIDEDEEDKLQRFQAATKKSGSEGLPVKRRRLTKVDDSRMAQPTEVPEEETEEHRPQAFQEAMMLWAAGSPARRYPALKAIVELPPSEPVKPRLLKDAHVLAQAGDYVVCFPLDEDVERLRQLEREFVVDHADMLEREPWHGKQTPADWCGLVNVILEEGASHQAIRSIVRGQTPGHNTLALVRVRGANVVSKLVGYVHTFRDGNDLDVSHLKVDRAHQGKGLGGLLIAAAVRMALRNECELRQLRLVVLQRNERAVQLYSKLGFVDTSTSQKRVRTGSSATVAWRHMARVMHEPIEAFAEACEERVRS